MHRLRAMVKKALLTSPRNMSRLVSPGFFADLTPEFLWLEATNACSSRCAFCSIWRNAPAKSPLLPDEIEQTLADPLFRYLKIVVVSGGEPTLRDDLYQILIAIRNAVPRARIILSSSAMFPERLVRTVSLALESGIALEVGLSLDGISSKHDRVRGVPGLFENADRAVRELKGLQAHHARRLRLKISFLLTDATAGQLGSVRQYAASRGIAFNVQWYNQASYYQNVGRDQLSQREMLEIAALSLRPSILQSIGVRTLRGRSGRFACSALYNFCLLKCNGDLVPCFQMWDSCVGNVRQQAPSAIWRCECAHLVRGVVRDCQGCLNTCGVQWSYDANLLGRVAFYLRHPRALLARLDL